MTLFKFLDLKYRNNALELQSGYSPQKDGYGQAAIWLIGILRSFGKFFGAFKLLGEYVLVKAHISAEPQEPVNSKAKKHLEAPAPSAEPAQVNA
jgi:hypothetical protein